VKRARFVAPAREEFLAEVAYYNQVQSGQGARFAAAVEEATARALAFPLAGSPWHQGIRRVVLKKFPFSIAEFPRASVDRKERCSTHGAVTRERR
jgi:toxin ParE1/3/4